MFPLVLINGTLRNADKKNNIRVHLRPIHQKNCPIWAALLYSRPVKNRKMLNGSSKKRPHERARAGVGVSFGGYGRFRSRPGVVTVKSKVAAAGKARYRLAECRFP